MPDEAYLADLHDRIETRSTIKMIKSVTIRRFKQLQELTIPLTQLTLLVGANNSGKSSILQAVHFAISLSQSAKLAGGVSWKNDTYELSLNPAQLLYTPIADVMALATGGKLAEAKAQQQVEVILLDASGQRVTVAISRGRNRNVAISIKGRTLGEQLQNLAKPFSVYAPGLAGVPKEELYMSAGRVQRIVARGDANLVLRNVLWMLKRSPDQWNLFREDIAAIFPGITIEVSFNDQTDEYIKAEFSRDDGPMLPLDAAGTSLLQATQLLSYVSLFQPQILILDEPDSHLHPNNQRRFCKHIAELADKRGFQIIMSTHSRHMLDALKRTGNLIWINDGKLVDGAEYEVASLLLDLGALDSVDYFANVQLKYLVMTEDQNTSLLKSLLWSSGFSPDDTEVVSYSGCSKVEAATVLGRFIKSKASSVVVIVHRDCDYLATDDVDKYCEHLAGHGLYPFVTDGNDIESYFLNVDHLSECNPGMEKAKIEELVEQAIKEARDATIKAMVNMRTSDAFKKRSNSNWQVDHGAIALAVTKEFDDNPKGSVRGKEALGLLKAKIQQELKQNPQIALQSQFLAVPQLRKILQDSAAKPDILELV